MRGNWFKYLIMVCLLVVYINRGLFVVMPGVELSGSTDNEINSIIELVLDLTGRSNQVDEDGDCPESYSFSTIAQPLIAQNLNYTISLGCLYATELNQFYTFDESIHTIDYNKTIEHPPEELRIES